MPSPFLPRRNVFGIAAGLTRVAAAAVTRAAAAQAAARPGPARAHRTAQRRPAYAFAAVRAGRLHGGRPRADFPFLKGKRA